MNKFISLTKIQIKNLFKKSQHGMNVKNNAIGKLLMLALAIALMTPAINFSVFTFKSFAMMNHPELVITSMYVMAAVLMLMMSFPVLVSVFFYSKDIRFLASLPIRGEVIVFSKLSTVYLYLFGISVFLIGPAMVVYGIHLGFDLSFILLGLMGLILAPILPLLIASLLVLPSMRIISNSRHRNLLAILGNVILIIAIIGVQLGVTKYMTNPEILQEIFSKQEGLLGFVGMRFPPSIWMTKMILGSIKDTILFLGLNLLLILLLQLTARVFYKRSVLAFNQGGATGGGKIYYVKRTKGWQLIRRNVFIILKQPTFFLNTVLSLFVPILMFVMMSFTGEVTLQMLKAPEIMPFMIFIFTGIIISPAIIANISCTAITREGKSFWETKVLPITPKENMKYRIHTTLIFNFLGSALLLIVSIFMLPVTLEMVLIGSFFCITVTLFFATADFIVNIYRPLLHWTHPTAAVKNNLNIMISLGIRAVVGLILFFAFKNLPLNFAYETLMLLGGILFFILYLVTRYVLNTYYVKKFARIEP